MPRQTFMHRVLASGDPARVWQGLQRPESWGRIGGVRNVEQPTFDANGDLTGYRFTVELGGKTHFGVARRSESTPGSRVSMAIDTDLMAGEIDVELEPSDDQTAITVAMTIESKGFRTAMLFPVITRAIASGFNEEVARFAKGLIEDRLYPNHRPPEAGQQLD